jgi:hypothetical protein
MLPYASKTNKQRAPHPEMLTNPPSYETVMHAGVPVSCTSNTLLQGLCTQWYLEETQVQDGFQRERAQCTATFQAQYQRLTDAFAHVSRRIDSREAEALARLHETRQQTLATYLPVIRDFGAILGGSNSTVYSSVTEVYQTMRTWFVNLASPWIL